MEQSVRGKILSILSEPTKVQDIKKAIPRIKSFGTVAYHLKQLEREGIITKHKEKKKQGQPTFYKIQSREVLNKIKQDKEEDKKYKILFLKYLEQNPGVSDKQLIADLMNVGLDLGIIGDLTTDCLNDNLYVLMYKITPKGKKFLEENK